MSSEIIVALLRLREHYWESSARYIQPAKTTYQLQRLEEKDKLKLRTSTTLMSGYGNRK